IYASDVRSIAQAPGSAIVRYHANICDVQIVHDWFFEWGLFAADYRPEAGKPVEPMRVLLAVRATASGNSHASWSYLTSGEPRRIKI
ncbi:MAG TPA: hypothetical protein VK720_12140, partial [Terracidiphilus sp.]|nr:hypothetical protein [Terracidiphilus sp.]